MLFNLVLVNNAILSCFFSFFLIINLHYLAPAFIAQMFDPYAEQAAPKRTLIFI